MARRQKYDENAAVAATNAKSAKRKELSANATECQSVVVTCLRARR